ncbi:hypothetical protein CCHL11_08752 [Colletotrichum chlorophyti]|uniref:DUF7719 domain-containing protein n=1 Tax=Colletotrichum chlorophyti TaxID=708187 RepID=A0A1Q8REM5_9PEZI|nr:hypothetical protein CCHL11_08752 [Colletotrichum chlorophyti]
MAKKQKRVKDPKGIPLAQPDRSGPSEATLLQLAQERGLFKQAEQDPRNKKKLPKGAARIDRPANNEESDDDDEDDDEVLLSPLMDRIMDTLLWAVSLAMVHVLSFLFYNLHAHPSSPILVPRVPLRFQHPIRQSIFFLASVSAGCHLLYVTNEFSYLHVLKRAPTLGCVWIWSVLELDLTVAVGSLAVVAGYLLQKGYAIK